MIAPDEHVRIGFGVFFIVAPMAVGWAGGRSGHGKRFMRVFAVHATLATMLGMTGILLARWYLIPSPDTAIGPGPAHPPFVSSGRVEFFIVSEVLALAALPVALIACGSALAQVLSDRRWNWLVVLLCVCALPLVLADVLFTLDFLHEEPHRALLLGSCVLIVVATVGIAAYAFTGRAQQPSFVGALSS